MKVTCQSTTATDCSHRATSMSTIKARTAAKGCYLQTKASYLRPLKPKSLEPTTTFAVIYFVEMEQATGSLIPTSGPRVVLVSVIPGPSSATTSSTQPPTANPTAATPSTQPSTANPTAATPNTQPSTANPTAATLSTRPSTLAATAATAVAAGASSGAGNTVAGKCLTCIFNYAVFRVGVGVCTAYCLKIQC